MKIKECKYTFRMKKIIDFLETLYNAFNNNILLKYFAAENASENNPGKAGITNRKRNVSDYLFRDRRIAPVPFTGH